MMLKHKDIIERLTESQKIRVLTSIRALEDKDFVILGVPRVAFGNIKDYNRDIFPHATVLSNAWDDGLWEEVAEENARRMTAEDIGFAIVPGARIKLSPYRREISEDTYLAAQMSAAYQRGVREAGLAVGVSGYYLTESDAAWMDSAPNDRIINDYVTEPYRSAIKAGGAEAVLTDLRMPSESYSGVCRNMQKKISGDTEFLICPHATDINTVELISRGVICFEASANALDAAYSRYKKIKRSVDNGDGATQAQLEDELSSFAAISDTQLDNAVDKLLDFAEKCRTGAPLAESTDEKRAELSLRASLESVVLLKNSYGTLPLSKKSKVAIIGDIAYEGEPTTAEKLRGALEMRGHTCVGMTRGYSLSDIGEFQSMRDAVELCKSADVAVLFLGFSYEAEKRVAINESLTIPANQLYLADRLSSMGKRIVVVLASGHAPDIEFTRPFGTVLLAPTKVDSMAEALATVLSGEYNPTGRLAYSLYAGTEIGFEKQRTYRKRFGMKVGPFIGYRYYDTAGLCVGYPFGHGLSYTEFAYSALTVSGNRISFNVENVGDLDGTEVAQIYVGCDSGARVRPKKELCSFVRVELSPGEKKRVTLDIELPTIYENGTSVTESAGYTVYVGASVSDIRLKGKITAEGKELLPCGERLCDYLQSESNVTEDNFTLEADYSLMKKSVKNILFGIGSLALAISVAVFNAFTEASSVFLGIVAGILAVAAIVFFIIEAAERNRISAEERKNIEAVNKEYFDGAEELPVLSSSKMFADEFDNEVVSARADSEEAVDDFAPDNRLEYIDASFRMADAAAELYKFAAERGFRAKDGTFEGVLASMATSRLITLDGLSQSEFNSFVRILSEYFGTDTFIDNVSSNAAGDAFYTTDAQGDRTKKNLLLAIEAAERAPEKIQIAALNGISSASVLDTISPMMRYISSPKGKEEIFVSGDTGATVGHIIASNLWIFINLAHAEGADMLPLNVARASAVNRIILTKCQSNSAHTLVHGLNRYQLEYAAEKEGGALDIPEELWKKIDKLERYVSDYSDYSIGNKLTLAFEKQLALTLLYKSELAEALDTAMAIKLIPSMAAAVRGKLSKEDKTLLETLEFTFGEENVECCKELINSFTDRKNARGH